MDMQLTSVSFQTSQTWTSQRNQGHLKASFSTLSLNHSIQPFFLWLKNTYVYVCKYVFYIYILKMPISLSNILAICHFRNKNNLSPLQKSPRIISCSSYASVSFRAYLAKSTHHPPSSVSGEPCRSFRSRSDSRCWRKCIETGVSRVWKGAIFVGDKGGTLCKYIHVPSHAIPASCGEKHPKRLRLKLKIVHLRDHCVQFKFGTVDHSCTSWKSTFHISHQFSNV